MAFCNIFDAARSDDAGLIEELLEYGGNSPNELNELGLTALHICATYDSLSALMVLIRYGADPHIRDKESGWTALHRALYFGHVRISLALIKAGARVDGKMSPNVYPWDREGLTPLDLICSTYSADLLEAKSKTITSCIVSFGKADFTLGVALPKASETVQPKRIGTLSMECITQVSTNRHHSAAVAACGACYTWGNGRAGRLGHGDEVSQPEPRRIALFGGHNQPRITQIATGENHTVVITANGDVYSWGSDRFGQLGHGGGNSSIPSSAPSLSSGSASSSGSVSGLGGAMCLAPRRLEALRRECVTAVAAGDAHTLCVTREGELYAWGSNKSGQLGLKRTELSHLPGGGSGSAVPKRVCIDGITTAAPATANKKGGFVSYSTDRRRGNRILQIAASHNNSLLVFRRPFAHSASGNEVYQWGHGIFVPVRVTFDAVTKKRSSSLGTKEGGGAEFIPVGARRAVNIIEVASGQHHYVALSADGSVYTWGAGAEQLGHGQPALTLPEDRVSEEGHLSTPRVVTALAPESGRAKVTAVAAASNRTCAVTERGELFTWGATEKQGVLTPGPSSYEPVPTAVPGIRRAIAVTAGPDHTLVLTAATLPPLPLATHPMFQHLCPQTGSELQQEEGEGEAAEQSVDQSFEIADEGVDADQAEELFGGAVARHMGDELESNASHQENEGRIADEDESVNPRDDEAEESAVPTLFALCQRQLAKSVNAKTAISALVFADQFDGKLLGEYCTRFLQRNFDAVLTATNKADLDAFAASLGYQEPAKGHRSDSFLQQVPPVTMPSRSTPSKAGQKQGVSPAQTPKATPAKTTAIVAQDEKEADKTLTAEDVRRQIKSAKKKLASIEELKQRLSTEGGSALSKEQSEKLERRPALHLELARLEQMLVRCEVREDRQRSVEAAATAAPASTPPVAAVASTPTKECAVRTALDEPFEKVSNKKKLKPVKGKAISLEEFQKMVDVSDQAKNVPAPPAASVSEKKTWKVPVREEGTNLGPALSSATALGRTVLSPPSAKAPSPPPSASKPRSGSFGKSAAAPPTHPPAHTPADAKVEGTDARPRGLLLSDFLPSSSAKSSAVSTPTHAAKPTWSTPTPATPSAAAPTGKPMIFSEIQRSEEAARQASNMTALKGNSNPWYVERRPRGDSLEEVVRQQQREKEEAEEVRKALLAVQEVEQREKEKQKRKSSGKKANKGGEGRGRAGGKANSAAKA